MIFFYFRSVRDDVKVQTTLYSLKSAMTDYTAIEKLASYYRSNRNQKKKIMKISFFCILEYSYNTKSNLKKDLRFFHRCTLIMNHFTSSGLDSLLSKLFKCQKKTRLKHFSA